MPDDTPLAVQIARPLPEIDPVTSSIPRRFTPPPGYFVSERQGLSRDGIPVRRVSRSRIDVETFDRAAARGAEHRRRLREHPA